MFLFILESIGTSELILIGIVALIFLGPRKLPDMARKAGKIMAEFRGTASEFKETWQREVDFEEEKKAFSLDALEAEPVPRVDPAAESQSGEVAPPAIRAVDPADFKDLVPTTDDKDENADTAETDDADEKKNWL